MGEVVMRRVIPSDNSCLFNAVGYVMEHDKNKSSELRQVIAATVESDHNHYNEAFLGRKNEEYCNWILDPKHWGGAIELSILAIIMVVKLQHMIFKHLAFIRIIFSVTAAGAIELSILADYYGREIAAYDIQTSRCDLYGQGKDYTERVMLIYDGLHYDALAMSPFDSAPEEVDQTIFSVEDDGNIGVAQVLAETLVKDCQRKRDFTDTANFKLRCAVCQQGLVGQKEAVEHAKATGHGNFQEC